MNHRLSPEQKLDLFMKLSECTFLDEVLDVLVAETGASARFDGCLINLFDEDENAFFCRKIRLPPALKHMETSYPGYKFALHDSDLNGMSMDTGSVIVSDRRRIKDVYDATGERFYRWNMYSLGVVPMISGGHRKGSDSARCSELGDAERPECIPTQSVGTRGAGLSGDTNAGVSDDVSVGAGFTERESELHLRGIDAVEPAVRRCGTLMVFNLDRDIDPEALEGIREKLSLCCGAVSSAMKLDKCEERVKSTLVLKDKTESLMDFITTTNRLYPLETMFQRILDELLRTFGFNSGIIWIREDDELVLKSSAVSGQDHLEKLTQFNQYFKDRPCRLDPPDCVVAGQFVKNQAFHVPDALPLMNLETLYKKDRQALNILKTPRTTVHVPIQYKNEPMGMVTLGSLDDVIEVSESDIRIIKSVCALIATTIENSALYTTIGEQKKEIEEFNLHLEEKVRAQTREIRFHLEEKTQLLEACDRFVPHKFLDLMGKESIKDVKLGDNTQKRISVLFADIRKFTSLSEKMTPEQNFMFLNEYLHIMGPVIRKHKGFIDKFIGDAIMALFVDADQAILAGFEMLENLDIFNRDRSQRSQEPIRIGIGINTGDLMLGTIGEHHRMETTVISDAVNLASRIEELTKQYGIPFLISEYTYNDLTDPDIHGIFKVDRVQIRGKSEMITIFGMKTA